VYATSKVVQVNGCTGVVHGYMVTGNVQGYTGIADEHGNRITGLVQVYHRSVGVVQEYTGAGVGQGYRDT